MKRNAFTIVELLILCCMIAALTAGLVAFLNGVQGCQQRAKDSMQRFEQRRAEDAKRVERDTRMAEEALAKHYADTAAIRIAIDALIKTLNKQPLAEQP